MQIGYTVPQQPDESDLEQAERRLTIAQASLLGTKLMRHLCINNVWQDCDVYRLDRVFTPGWWPWRAPAEIRMYALPRPSRLWWATSPGLSEDGMFYDLTPVGVLQTTTRRIDGPYPLGWHDHPEFMVEVLREALQRFKLSAD